MATAIEEVVAARRDRGRPDDAALVDALATRADLVLGLDDDDRAIDAYVDWYDAAVAVHGEDSSEASLARRLVGRAYRYAERDADAVSWWEPMIEREGSLAHPEHIDEVLYEIVDAYLALGRPDDARRAADRLLDAGDPPRKRPRMKLGDEGRAHLLWKVGRREAAVKLLYDLALWYGDDGYRHTARGLLRQVELWDEELRAEKRAKD